MIQSKYDKGTHGQDIKEYHFMCTSKEILLLLLLVREIQQLKHLKSYFKSLMKNRQIDGKDDGDSDSNGDSGGDDDITPCASKSAMKVGWISSTLLQTSADCSIGV